MAKYKGSTYKVGIWTLVRRNGTASWFRYARIDGKTISRSLGSADFDEAKRKLQEWCVEFGYSTNSPPDLMADVLRQYQRERQQAVSYNNIKIYCRLWMLNCGQMCVREACSYLQQEAFIRSLVLRGLKPSSINGVIGIGRAAVRLAYKRQLIDYQPPFIRVQVHDQPLMGRVVSISEIRLLIQNSPTYVQLYLLLLMGTLGRPSAVLQLTWSQVDFEAHQVALNPVNRVQNKKHRPTIVLPPTLITMLHTKRQESGRIIQKCGRGINTVRTGWRRARLESGLGEDVTLYSFRHTVARHLRRVGVPMDQIQYQLGHKKLGVSERYLNIGPEDFREVTAGIEAFLKLVLDVTVLDLS